MVYQLILLNINCPKKDNKGMFYQLILLNINCPRKDDKGTYVLSTHFIEH